MCKNILICQFLKLLGSSERNHKYEFSHHFPLSEYFSLSSFFTSGIFDTLFIILISGNFIQLGTNDLHNKYNFCLSLEFSGFSVILFSELFQVVMSSCFKNCVFFFGDWVNNVSIRWKCIDTWNGIVSSWKPFIKVLKTRQLFNYLNWGQNCQL